MDFFYPTKRQTLRFNLKTEFDIKQGKKTNTSQVKTIGLTVF